LLLLLHCRLRLPHGRLLEHLAIVKLALCHVPIEQLAKNVRTFVAARPDLQKKPVQVGLINYLIELCGAPPN